MLYSCNHLLSLFLYFLQKVYNCSYIFVDKEHIADLENKIEDQKMEIENHIRIITALETRKFANLLTSCKR